MEKAVVMTDNTENAGPDVAETTPTPNQQPVEEVDVAAAQFIAPPAFQFYASDFLGSTKVGRMSLTEIGVFTLLLCHAWNANGLPTSIPEVARLGRMDPRRFKRMWDGVLSECWVERKGRLFNPRQEQIRKDLIAYRLKQKANGQLGGRPRKPEQTQPKPNGKPKAKPNITSPISSLPSTDVSKEQKHPAPHPVKAFLTHYDELFFALIGEHPVISKGRDAGIAKRTISDVGEPRARMLLAAFFESSDPFIRNSGYGLNVFAGQLNKLIAGPRPLAATGTEGRGRTGAPPRGKYDGIEEQD